MIAEIGGGVPWPARIVQRGACERDRIGLAVDEELFRLLGLGDETNRDGGNIRSSADALGERDLIAGTELDLLRRRQATAGDVDRGGSRAPSSALRRLWS